MNDSTDMGQVLEANPLFYVSKGKGTLFPLQTRCGPEGG